MCVGRVSDPKCFCLIISSLAPFKVTSFLICSLRSSLLGKISASIPKRSKISSVSSIILYASLSLIYLNKSLFPSFGIKFNLPSLNVPAPPKPDKIWQGLQLTHFPVNFIGQTRFFASFPLSIKHTFRLGLLVISS